MMKGLREFLQEVKQDPKVREEIGKCTDEIAVANLVVRLGRERGYTFSTDEVTASVRESGELSDADLARTSGGTIFRVNVDKDEAVIVKRRVSCFPYCQSDSGGTQAPNPPVT
jgi:predicted ribosomally synthesized peptide with nif11-like leader